MHCQGCTQRVSPLDGKVPGDRPGTWKKVKYCPRCLVVEGQTGLLPAELGGPMYPRR